MSCSSCKTQNQEIAGIPIHLVLIPAAVGVVSLVLIFAALLPKKFG